MLSRRVSCRLLMAILVVALICEVRSVQAAIATPRVIDEEALAIPDVTLLGMSPTGQWLLGERGPEDGPHQLCSYDIETLVEVACADLMTAGYGESLDRASVRWSPDATQIAFTEDTSVGNEGDIWTLTMATGAISNLTDDGINDNIAFGSVDPAATSDVSPAWSPASSAIAFAREAHITDEGAPDRLSRLELTTGVVTEILALPSVLFSDFVRGIHWLNDGEIVYEILDKEQNVRTIWTVDPAGGGAHSVTTVFGILLDVCAQGQALSSYDLTSEV